MGPQFSFFFIFSSILFCSLLNVKETVQQDIYRRPLLPYVWSAVRKSAINQSLLTEKVFFDSPRELVRVDQTFGNQSSIHLYFFGESRYYKITGGTDNQAICEKLEAPETFIEDQAILDGLQEAELQVFPETFYQVAYVWHTGGSLPDPSGLKERSPPVADLTFYANNKTAVYYEDSETGNPLRWIVNNITIDYTNVKEEAIDLALLTPPPLLRCPGYQRRYTRDVQSITPPSFPPYWSANRVRTSQAGTFFDIVIYDDFSSSLRITSSASSSYQSSSFYFSNFHKKTNYMISTRPTDLTCTRVEQSAVPFFEENSLLTSMSLVGLFFKQGVLVYCWKNQGTTFCDDAFSRLPVSLERNGVIIEYSSVQVSRPDPSVFSVNAVQACSALIPSSFEDLPPIKVPEFPPTWKAVVSNPPHSSILEFDYPRQVFRETPITNGSPDTRIYFMEKKRSYRALRDAATHIYPRCLTAPTRHPSFIWRWSTSTHIAWLVKLLLDKFCAIDGMSPQQEGLNKLSFLMCSAINQSKSLIMTQSLTSFKISKHHHLI
eukprot:TRINITY_DN5115_c0_g1_i1.p1 TRINITY_DN5115_c0_g1~~TRINITY_DN5115_c0_g1_i1.p1  ORF type:complete len:547 (-),score=77.92 TRINITY_DN5115_c0_g1_i1:402-2042(-)